MFSLLIVSGHLLTAFLLVGLCLILYSTGVGMAEDSVTSYARLHNLLLCDVKDIWKRKA